MKNPETCGAWDLKWLFEVSEWCHPCPARFCLVCTGRAHTYFWNKPLTLKTPNLLFLLQKTNVEGPETNCCSAKGPDPLGLRPLIFPTWAEVNKQDFNIKTQTSADFLSSLWYSGRGRETTCKASATQTAAWDCLQKLKSRRRWRTSGPFSPYLLHTDNHRSQDESLIFSWQLDTCFILNKNTHKNLRETEIIWNDLWYITKQFL